MPPKPRITREMILDAAYAIARERGAEQINARTIAGRLGSSTQPVLYHFDHIEDIRREVYHMADEYQTTYLMQMPQDQNPMIALGLNYIRFAAKEKPLFRFLCQSDSFQEKSITALTETPQLLPMLQIFQKETNLTPVQVKMVFRTLIMLVHGCASLLANNTMEYDEDEIVPMLQMAFTGMVGAMKMEESQE